MRIGILTDTYHPIVNGITFVVEETKRELEGLGHEVFVVCPCIDCRKTDFDEEKKILHLPARKDIFFEDQMTSFFFPPSQIKRLRELNFDVMMFTTPGQIGLLGVYTALKNDIPLVALYCTDLYEYVRHYPRVVPAVLAQVVASPITLGARTPELRNLIASFGARAESEHWSQKLVSEMLTILHNRCQAVITPSQKIHDQLKGWGTTSPIHVIPTGISPLPYTDEEALSFRDRLGIGANQPIILSVGRLGSEKNVELTIDAFAIVKDAQPNAKLVIVGESYQHGDTLKARAAETRLKDDIIFTGKIPRRELGPVYGASDVFVFPSVTDTQGLVIHEAADAGLPIVICDDQVSEVAQDQINALVAQNDPVDFASKIVTILSDTKKRSQMGKKSREIVSRYTATKQAEKLLLVLQEAAHAKQVASLSKKQ